MVKTCKICQDSYEYCGHCAIKHIPYKQQGMCSNACYEISNIIQRYRGNVMTADEAAIALEACGADNKQLQPKIDRYYQDILDKVTRPVIQEEVVLPQENVEVVIINDEDTTTSYDE